MNHEEGSSPLNSDGVVDAAAIVSLAIASDPSFGRALESGGVTQGDARRGLGEALNDMASDMHSLDIERVGGLVVGLACTCPVDELAGRRLATLRHLIQAAPGATGLRKALMAFAIGVPAAEGGGLYLSRISVAKDARGSGIGARLMSRLEERARRDANGITTLHVAIENIDALAFYRHRGYDVIKTGTSHHLLRRVARDLS